VAVERFGETVVMEELMAVQVLGLNRIWEGLMIESPGHRRICLLPPLQKHLFQKSIRKIIKKRKPQFPFVSIDFLTFPYLLVEMQFIEVSITNFITVFVRFPFN
jgi:hypothetical protein